MKFWTRLKWLKTSIMGDHLRYGIKPSVHITFHDKLNSQGFPSTELNKQELNYFEGYAVFLPAKDLVRPHF
jgi:hypothetical protein